MNEVLIRRLFNLGWSAFKSLEEALQNPQTVEQTQAQYAAFHGLSDLNDVQAHLLEPRICGLPDVMPLNTGVCKWPDALITWDIVGEIKGLSRDQVQQGITEALARWAKVCGIRPQFTPNEPMARIQVGSRSIDGPMGVLAESELPCGSVKRCRQWYDSGEAWALFDGPGSGIDFVRVATHELGHALGMNHIGGGNLLAPTYSQTIWTPQAGDIAEMQARYGPPASSPPPPPTGADEIIVRIKGSVSVDGYRLTKLLSTE